MIDQNIIEQANKKLEELNNNFRLQNIPIRWHQKNVESSSTAAVKFFSAEDAQQIDDDYFKKLVFNEFTISM